MKGKIWIQLTIILQILSGLLHATSFFIPLEASNEQEKQLIAAITGYQMDMGAGIHRNFLSLFTSMSICFTLLCLLAAAINIFLLRKKVSASLLKGVMGIQTVTFGISLICMFVFAFILPVVCVGLVFLSAMAAWLNVNESA